MGNAICFIRLFYKPDIQFVLEDLVTDFSVNSQIITITGERGERREREVGLEGRGLLAYLGGRVPEDRIHPRLPPGWEARPQRGVGQKAPESASAPGLLHPPAFSNPQTLCSPQQDSEVT